MRIQKQLVFFLFITIILSAFSCAFALEWDEYADVSGHWAEETMLSGLSDGLIEGYEDGTLRPDSAITTAQMITILTRLLNASEKAEISADEGVWYYEALQKAVWLGLVDGSCSVDSVMTRQDAFSMMARAFSLTPADPDLNVLPKFSDASAISAANRPAIAQLISDGLVVGYGGALNTNGSITRAEFLTVLYRLAKNYVPAKSLGSVTGGGSVISGGGNLLNLRLTDGVWFDCSSSNISLCAVEADEITIRSHKLTRLAVYGNSNISRLVLDCGSCTIDDFAFSGAAITTLQLAGSCNAVIAEDNVRNIEITSKGVSAEISGTHDSVAVSANGANVAVSGTYGKLKIIGDGNTITLAGKASVSSIEISGSSNTVVLGSEALVSGLTVSGSSNTVTLTPDMAVSRMEVSGNSNTISIDGDTDSISVSDMAISGGSNSVKINGRAENISVSGLYNHITVEGKAGSVTVAGRGAVIDGGGSADSAVIEAQDCTVTLKIAHLTDNSHKMETERVLELVTLGYKGNYTLKWAQEHDYKDFEKEIWINAKGYSSETDYLIWVNLSMQRVNIFKGKTGGWKLVHSCIVGTGAPGTGTPPGVYYTTYKNYNGWTTRTYTVKPVIGFKVNTGYAFHSRIYYPGTTRLSDSSIGYPISHGCVRMYDEDVRYIYNNIPLRTTVVVY